MPSHKARSLRYTLIIWLLAPLMVLLPARAWFQYQDRVHEANFAFDRALADAALAVSNLVHVEHEQIHVAISSETETFLRTDATDTQYIAVLDQAGHMVWGDAALANAALHNQGPLSGLTNVSVFNTQINGKPVEGVAKEFSCGAQRCRALAAETVLKRQVIERRVLRSTLWFIFALLVTLAVLIRVLVAYTLKPLTMLSAEVSRRSLEDLRPLDTAMVPQEIFSLIQAVNQLFTRLKQSADAQGAFLSDAAHQLRTPLTSLRTEAELALLENTNAAIKPSLERIHESAERAARLASQLLLQARTEARQQGPSAYERYDLKTVAEHAAVEWVPRALRLSIDLGFQLESAPVWAEPFALSELLSNLIHNAIEYGVPPDHSEARITVRTMVDGGHSILEVEDNGIGIPDDEKLRVLERFQRGKHAPPGGSGLGLAIVRDITLHHGGRIELLDAVDPPLVPRGTRVRLSFPYLG